LRAEDMELLLGKLPTADEAKLVLMHAGAQRQLRDIEEKILPLCRLQDAEIRLRIAHIAATHVAQHTRLMERVGTMQVASAEVLTSTKLHKVLRTALKVANYINHGDRTGSTGAKAISMRSLPAFTAYTIGGASALDYLCVTLCDVDFLEELTSDLRNVPGAARENSRTLKQELDAFRWACRFVESHAKPLIEKAVLEEEPSMISWLFEAMLPTTVTTAEEQLGALLEVLRREERELERGHKAAELACAEAQHFLGDQSGSLAAEEFFGHLAGFLSALLRAGPGAHKRFRAASEPQGGDSP